MENQSKLAGMHAEHAGWQNEIVRYKDELSTMKDQLAAIVAKHPPREVPASAEHFQNQFILQRDVIDRMRHDFKQYENRIEDEQKSGSEASGDLVKERDAYKSRLGDFDRLFHELKNEFEVFKANESIPAWSLGQVKYNRFN